MRCPRTEEKKARTVENGVRFVDSGVRSATDFIFDAHYTLPRAMRGPRTLQSRHAAFLLR